MRLSGEMIELFWATILVGRENHISHVGVLFSRYITLTWLYWILKLTAMRNVAFLMTLYEPQVQRNNNQEFALGFNLVYIHDKDWLCTGWNCNAQTSKFLCSLPKPIRTWNPRRFPFGHVSGHVDTWPIQNRRIPQVHTYVLTPGKKFHLPRINIGQEPWLAMLRW